jgi:hypothetical protein
MNIAKHMEAIFVAAAVLLGFSAYATAAQPVIQVRAAAVSVAADSAKMPVVVVSHKRLAK